MKIAWIFPAREKCGIAVYSRGYAEALRELATIETLDPSGYSGDPRAFASRANACDVVHIQYEPSFFMHNRSDFYGSLCRSLRRPLFVTMHEVYSSPPGVFPRESVRGRGLIRKIRLAMYDRRHPGQKAHRIHARNSFFARKVLVHHEYHKSILMGQGVHPGCLMFLPYPVKIPSVAPVPFRSAPSKPALLAGIGFINPNYDYELLFAALKRLDLPWTFTWIGGIRSEEHAAVERKIRQAIRENGWENRFTITGWVDDIVQDKLIGSSDCVCALFSARSSSGSIAAALGSCKPVVATPLPLTEELAAPYGVVHLTQATAEAVAAGIRAVLTDDQVRSRLQKNVDQYRQECRYEVLAKKLMNLYKEYT
jgi:hypothetical protein